MGNTSSEPEAVPIDLATLPKPYKRDDCMFFSVVPVEESSGLQQVGGFYPGGYLSSYPQSGLCQCGRFGN